jgi:hypothetical protein
MARRKGPSLSQQIKMYKGNVVGVHGDPFGAIGNLSPGQRVKRGRRKITEDDPRWRPKR